VNLGLLLLALAVLMTACAVAMPYPDIRQEG
jgi:hypothetical protein